MSMYEKIENVATSFNGTLSDYARVENDFMSLLRETAIGAELRTPYGSGVTLNLLGENLEEATIVVGTGDGLKKFSVKFIITTSRLTKFLDDEVISTVTKIYTAHSEILGQCKALERLAATQAKEAEKKAEAERKAEVKRQRVKEKAIKDFEALISRPKTTKQVNDFYCALGWLAKHIGSVSAALPDYLEDSFVKHFGNVSSVRIVDSKKKTVNGNSMQWTFGFKATLQKIDKVPAILVPYLSSSGKAIANTSFIWELIDSYGFQFGKNQDVNQILVHIPTDFVDSFQTGFMD